jgi:hypothetical protein
MDIYNTLRIAEKKGDTKEKSCCVLLWCCCQLSSLRHEELRLLHLLLRRSPLGGLDHNLCGLQSLEYLWWVMPI